MKWHTYYVWWWSTGHDGPALISGPHFWFAIPIEQANAMDAQVSATMLNPHNPYRGTNRGQIFYTVKTTENDSAPPAQPKPNDPTLEALP